MNFNKAKEFIYKNARPLDCARWQYLFENGSRENVLNFLAAYQNEDGGFGHALEADCWNPDSSPVQTWAAIQIIREVDLKEKEHPIILGILRYLENTNVKYSQAASGINMTVALDKNTFMYYNALQKERWQTWRTAMYFL